MSKPKLRFKADDGSDFSEWKEKIFADILSENKIPIPKPLDGYERLGIRSHGKGTFHEYVPAGEGLDVDTMYVVEAYNLILNITFAWEQAIAITDDNDAGKLVSHRFPQYRFNDGYDWHFFKYDILDKKLKHELGLASPGGAGRNRVLNKSAFLKIKRVVPCLSEQRKIATFLSNIDEIISTTEAEVSTWEERKKGIMQKLFNQEVRFKADDGSDYPEWEVKRLEVLTNRVSRRNKDGISDIPLTISSANGLIDQRKYFNKVVAAQDLTNYYLLKKGEFAYNRSSSVGYDFGAIKRLDEYGCGAVSTLYICFSIKEDSAVYSDFLVEYFDSCKWNKYAGTVCAEGARNHGLLNISINDFFNMPILLPSLPEQKKIADCLFSLDDVINQTKEELSAWQEFKKGLLQQMFV